MKTKILKTYNSILLITISLLEFKLSNLLKLKSKNFIALDYGIIQTKYKKIPKAYLNSNTNQVVILNSNELRLQNNINNIYKIIGENLNADENEIRLLSKKQAQRDDSIKPMYFKELNCSNYDFTKEEYIDNNYKEEVIRK